MSVNTWQLLPELSAEEYEALKADIAERGVQVPVELDEHGAIFDGHHRVRACQELGITDWPRVVRAGLSDEEKIEHALRLNVLRRQLTESQRAALAPLIALMLEDRRRRPRNAHGDNTPNVGCSHSSDRVRRAAAMVGVSHGLAYDAAKLRRDAPDLFAQVEAGELAVKRALRIHRRRLVPRLAEEGRLDDWTWEAP